MPLIAKDSGGAFELCPAGTFQARCYLIADTGSQVKNFTGETRLVHEIVIAWELNERMSDGRPFAISKTYTLSLNEKANLRKDLEAWRGRAFTEDELQAFDVFNVLNAQCFLNIIHVHKNGKTWANIGGIIALPKGTPHLQPVNDAVSFALDEYTPQTMAKLPNWIQDKIKKSPEGQAVTAMSGNDIPPAYDDAPPMTDDIPF